jgi:hypothetical protein
MRICLLLGLMFEKLLSAEVEKWGALHSFSSMRENFRALDSFCLYAHYFDGGKMGISTLASKLVFGTLL